VDEWLSYYAKENIRAVAMGGLILRRHPSPNFFIGFDIPDVPATPAVGEHVYALFQAQDYLRGLAGADGLLKRRLRPHPQVTVDQTLRQADGEFAVRACRMHVNTGLGFGDNLNSLTLQLLQGCDGKATLGEVLRRVADENGAPLDQVTKPCLDAATRWVQRGCLIPADV
jgi:hypothetical protein